MTLLKSAGLALKTSWLMTMVQAAQAASLTTSSAETYFPFVSVMPAYITLIFFHHAPAIVHRDAHGSWAQCSLLLKTGQTTFQLERDSEYVGVHRLIHPIRLIGGKVHQPIPARPSAIEATVTAVFGHQATVFINPGLDALTRVGLC